MLDIDAGIEEDDIILYVTSKSSLATNDICGAFNNCLVK